MTSFADEAPGNRSSSGAPGAGIRAKREIGMAVARVFNPAHESDKDANRAELVKVLVSQAGLSEVDANPVVTDWTASYERLKIELKAAKDTSEKKAREAADTAAKALAVFSFVYFVGFALGAVAASCGACHGEKCDSREDALIV